MFSVLTFFVLNEKKKSGYKAAFIKLLLKASVLGRKGRSRILTPKSDLLGFNFRLVTK